MPADTTLSAEYAHKRLNEIDGKVEYLKHKIDGITEIKTAVGVMTNKIDNFNKMTDKVDALDNKLDQLDVNFATLRGELKGRDEAERSFIQRITGLNFKELLAGILLIISVCRGGVDVDSPTDIQEAVRTILAQEARAEQQYYMPKDQFSAYPEE